MIETRVPGDPPSRRRRWGVAFLLSLLQPGLGQVYNGQARKGIAIYLAGLAASVLVFVLLLQPVPILVPMLLVAAVVVLWPLGAAAEAAWTAIRRGSELRLGRYNRWYVYLAPFLLSWPLAHWGIAPILHRFEQAFYMPSESMRPTLEVDERFIVDRARFHRAVPRRGEIVLYRSPADPAQRQIKRVVATGGDQVEIRDKRLFLNGRESKEPYAIHEDPRSFTGDSPFARRDNFGPYLVPPGHLFVLGDNRDNSRDSRFTGPVPFSAVEGGGRIRIYWSRDPATGAVRWDRVGRFVR